MSHIDDFKKKLDNREIVIGPCITGINSPLLVEKMLENNADFLLFDCEHGIFNNESLVSSLQITRLMKRIGIVRVPDTEYHLISRALYLGADGIMIPRTETVEQVKTAVESISFYPSGKLGCGGHGQYIQGETALDYKRLLFLQIESPKGIDNLPEMIEKYGEFISGIIIGPYDLSVMSGVAYQFDHPVLNENIKRVFDICLENKLSVGIFSDTVEGAKKHMEMGANILWTVTDTNLYVNAFKDIYSKLNELR